METSIFKNSEKNNDQDIYYYTTFEDKVINFNSSKSFQDIFNKRPFTFCVTTRSLEVSIDEAEEVFDKFNYNYQFKNNALIGIRSDLYVLGFNFDQLAMISSSSKKEDLAQELIAKSLDNTQSTTSYSREEEVEILNEIF